MASPQHEAIIHTDLKFVLRSPVAVYTLANVQRAAQELARMRQRLASDPDYFRSQISRLFSISDFIDGSDRQMRQALLQKSMRLLQQLLQIAAACLQQLSRQVSSYDSQDNDIMAPAAMFCASILERMSLVTQSIDAMASGASMSVNRQVLGLLQDTGVLATYTAAARAATQRLTHLLQQGHRVQPDAAQLQPRQEAVGSKLAANTAGIGAILLQVWICCTRLLPEPELMQAGSMFAATLQTSAALAVHVMRAYAPAGHHAAGPAYVVTKAALFVARTTAAHSAQPHRSFATLGPPSVLQDVLELLSMTLGLCCEVLHADHQGRSQQTLLKSLASAVHDGSSNATSSTSSGTSTTSSSTTSGTCTSTSCRDSPSRSCRMAVPPHHQELLYTLLGVRQLAHGFRESHTTEAVRNGLLTIAVGINGALTAPKKAREAARHGQAQHRNSSTSSNQAAAPNVPWVYALPLQLTLIEMLALAPPFLARNLKVMCAFVHLLEQLQLQLLNLQDQQLQTQPPALTTPSIRGSRNSGTASNRNSSTNISINNSSSHSTGSSSGDCQLLPVPFDAGRSRALAQLCMESMWLHLGPVLLSVCRLYDRDTDDDATDSEPFIIVAPIPGLTPRIVFAAYAAALLLAVKLQDLRHGCVVNIAAVIERNPLLCCIVAEAALHAVPSWSFEPYGPESQQPTQQAKVQYATLLHCFPAFILVNFIAEAGAQLLPTGGAAAAVQQDPVWHTVGQQLLRGPLFSLVVAALKHSLITPPGGVGDAGLFHIKLELVAGALLAGLRVLGRAEASTMCQYNLPQPSPSDANAAAEHLSNEHYLAIFALLARGLAAAASVLQLVPLHVTAAGDFVMQAAYYTQFQSLRSLLAPLRLVVQDMQHILQSGLGDLADAVAAGVPEYSTVIAGTTRAGVANLAQQAAALQDTLTPLCELYLCDRANFPGIQPNFDTLSQEQAAANSALRAASLPGSVLLAQLTEFAGGCYAAFPQPRCCGNAACSSLDGFSEAALAAKSCSRCKAVKFCSPECMRVAWKTGHKAACAVLKQRQSPAVPAALSATAAAPASTAQASLDLVAGNVPAV